VSTWISLLRGVNVGGKNIVKMAELRSMLEAMGFGNVQTYIQSGNCVYDSRKTSGLALSKSIAAQIKKEFGFEPSVMTISLAQLQKAIKQNPYEGRSDDPKSVHFFFLAKTATGADKNALNKMKASTEEFSLKKDVFYLFAPEGIARSKLAAGAEAKLGVPATARNYRTVQKLLELAA